MSGNTVDNGIRANDAVLNSLRETPTDASSSDSMLFKDYISGGQTLPKNIGLGAGSAADVDNYGSNTQILVSTAEDAARELIDSGHPEYSGPVSASDSFNAFMLSDNTRYNFETGTVQVLAQRAEGGIAWQNIGHVSPELAGKVSNEIINLNNERLVIQNSIGATAGGSNSPSEASPGSPATSPVTNTPASIGGQQSESTETATATVDTQGPLETTEEESGFPPNTVTSMGTDENNNSTTGFTDADGNHRIAEIDLETGNAVVSDLDGNVVMVGNIDTVTGETDFVDTNGEVVPAEDNPISTLQPIVNDEGRPGLTSSLPVTVAGTVVAQVRTPLDGGGDQTFHDENGQQIPGREPTMPNPGMPDENQEPQLDPVSLGNSNGTDSDGGNVQVDNSTDAAHDPQNQQTGQGAEALETFDSYFGDLTTAETTTTTTPLTVETHNNNRNGTSGSGGTASAASAASMGTGVSPTGSDIEGTPF